MPQVSDVLLISLNQWLGCQSTNKKWNLEICILDLAFNGQTLILKPEGDPIVSQHYVEEKGILNCKAPCKPGITGHVHV